MTGVTAVPDDDARRGILAGRQVTLHPAVPRYLDVLFPRANGRSLGNGGAEYLFSQTQPTDEHFYQLRIDHRPSAANSVFVRATHDRADVIRIPPNKPPIATVDEATRNTYVTGEYQHTFSQNTLNQLRLGLNRSVSLADNRRTIDIPPDMAWLPGEKFGYLTIQGLVTEMAGDFRLPRNDRLNNWQIGDIVDLDARTAPAPAWRAAAVPAVQPGHHQPGRRHRHLQQSRAVPHRPAIERRLRRAGKDRPDQALSAVAHRRLPAGRCARDGSAVAEPGAAL